MKYIVFFCLAFLKISSCIPEPENKYLTYQNIVILSDLSSRINNKPPKDIEEIRKILKYFKDECVKPGEKIGDKSCIIFSAFSDKVAVKVDLNDIKDVHEKQSFINSTGKYKSSGLSQKIKEFEDRVEDVYANTRNQGLDLISILIEKLENEPLVKKDKILTDGVDSTFIRYENHIYIFTDGYLEYVNKDINEQFYFGQQEIERVRLYCQMNNTTILKALEDNPTLCLPVYEGKMNSFVTLHIMETHERDKNEKLQNYSHVTGQRDNEILEAVWRKWAKESGFKDITWDKY